MESRLLGEINNFRYADDTTLMTESEEELKNLLMKVKQESEKSGLKLKIMASNPITSWKIDGVKVEAVTDFFSSCASKSLQMVTVAMKLEGGCFLELKL